MKIKEKKMEEKSKTLFAQLIIRAVIFLLFFLGIFIAIPFLPYLLIPLIIANVVLIFINKTKGIITNIFLLNLTLLLFIFLIEYIATILGAIISFVHALRFTLKYLKK